MSKRLNRSNRVTEGRQRIWARRLASRTRDSSDRAHRAPLALHRVRLRPHRPTSRQTPWFNPLRALHLLPVPNSPARRRTPLTDRPASPAVSLVSLTVIFLNIQSK